MKNRALLAGFFVIACSLSMGCKRIVSYAVDRALGDDAGIDLSSGGGSASSGGGTGGDVCKLVTNAEIEAASGKKVGKAEGSDDRCDWTLTGGSGIKGEDGTSGSISLQIASETTMKIIPVLGEQKAIPGLGDKAEWSGGMAPNLRIHKSGKVLNFMFVDPSAMMANPGITEKPVGKQTATGGDSVVNMEYPELEKEAIAIGKAAMSRYTP